jgi:hypothetical protein
MQNLVEIWSIQAYIQGIMYKKYDLFYEKNYKKGKEK